MSEKKHLNLLDFLIILLAAAILAGGAFFLISRQKNSHPSDEPTKLIVLEVKEQYGAYETMLKRGETLYDNIQNEEFGTLVDYKIQASVATTISQTDGTVRKTDIPDRYDFHLTIRVPESKSIVVGKSLSLRGKLYKCAGYVIGVSQDDTAADGQGEEQAA